MTHDTYTSTDRFEELDLIDLDEVFDLLEIYCRTMLPDLEACMVFLSRILKDQQASHHPKTRSWLELLVRKAVALGPLDRNVLGLASKLTHAPNIVELKEKLDRFNVDPTMLDMRSVMNNESSMRKKRAWLEETLKTTPGHIIAASQLLLLDYYQGIERGTWIDLLTVPKFAEQAWNARLFLHYAGLGIVDKAMMLWPFIAAGQLCEIQLNLAAELFVKSGDTEQAIVLYKESLKLDPHQMPVRHRIAELENQTKVNRALLSLKNVCICLYSWNKADDLERTLASLAKTDIGTAKIRVLLNGCTDNSAKVVATAKKLFPNNDFEAVPLLVNVGAPAARNWLGNLPEVRASEFVAYIDDDVELPADWLAHFLTVMKDNPKTAVVGCKVVFGSNQKMIQYLHRVFSIAAPGMIKLTESTQISLYDYGQYDYVCSTDTVMGCCHLLRMAHMPDGPQFDLRYSPSQVDDVAHDLALRVAGFDVHYCGLITCIHHQNTGGGFKRKMTKAQLGQVLGNDMKFYYYFIEKLERIRELMRKSN